MKDAEDLVMDSFAILLFKNKPFLGRFSFKTWLFSIGRNQALMFLRKKPPTPAFLDDIETHLIADSPDLSILKAEQNRMLFQTMTKLKPEYREALMLSYFEEMNLKQLSTVMKISKRRASDLLYRVKIALKNILKRRASPMRSLVEQMKEIKNREALLRKKKYRWNIKLLSTLSVVICLCLVASTYDFLPSIHHYTNLQTPMYYGAVLSANPVIGFAVIILLSFALGVCVTLLCFKLYKQK